MRQAGTFCDHARGAVYLSRPWTSFRGLSAAARLAVSIGDKGGPRRDVRRTKIAGPKPGGHRGEVIGSVDRPGGQGADRRDVAASHETINDWMARLRQTGTCVTDAGRDPRCQLGPCLASSSQHCNHSSVFLPLVSARSARIVRAPTVWPRLVFLQLHQYVRASAHPAKTQSRWKV